MRRAFALIGEYPETGALADDLELAGVRRVVLVGTQHFVYYRVTKDAVEVLAVWSTKRGERPPLR